MNFQRLYFLREDKDLTQEEMAKIIGVSRSAISQWETNKDIIPLSRLNKYCNYFNVSIDYIIGLNNIKDYGNNKIELDKKDIGRRIKEIRKINNLTLRSLANELNTSSSTISAYETGKVLIKTVFAFEICYKYNLSLDWLCGRK